MLLPAVRLSAFASACNCAAAPAVGQKTAPQNGAAPFAKKKSDVELTSASIYAKVLEDLDWHINSLGWWRL